MKRKIIFDAGEVLFFHNYKAIAKKLSEKIKLKKDLTERLKEIIIKADLGHGEVSAYIQEMFYKSNIKGSARKWYFKQLSATIKPNIELWSIVKKLSNKNDLFVASNNNPESVECYELFLPFLTTFKKHLYSFQIGCRKPERYFFMSLNVRVEGMEGTIYIDDQLKSKQAVQSFGAKFIQYKNPEQLRKELKKNGVIV